MAPRRHQQPAGLEVRMLAAMVLLGLVYAGIGWGLQLLFGMPVWVIVVLAAVVLALQWFGTERLALAATGAREVGPEQAPAVYQALERLCALTGQPKPRLAVSSDRVPNAFTVGRSHRHAVIVVTWGLRYWLDPPELETVLAHELAHIQHRDIAVMTLASSFALALAGLARRLARTVQWLLALGSGTALAVVMVGIAAATVLSAVAYLPLRALSRYRELAADRTAAIQLGQPALLASVLVKCHDESSRIPSADLRAQAVPAIGFVAKPSRFGPWFSTHPGLARRLSQLDALQVELG
jgi:heat shock protein HtpX